jgi:1-acyl-sn-glycerol-3-phosphate acyltransferase
LSTKLYERYKECVVGGFFESIKRTFNIHTTYHNFEKISRHNKKIFISNHVCYYDLFVLGGKVHTGAVISSTVNGFIIKSLTNFYPSLIINRGEKNNTVKLIEDFVEKNNDIFICPQGIFSHHTTIGKFRTGAFATKFNVQPIIIKYKEEIASISIMDIFMIDGIHVDLIAMDIIEKKELSPKQYADHVLTMMTETGNLKRSNVISYDVKDKTK